MARLVYGTAWLALPRGYRIIRLLRLFGFRVRANNGNYTDPRKRRETAIPLPLAGEGVAPRQSHDPTLGRLGSTGNIDSRDPRRAEQASAKAEQASPVDVDVDVETRAT